MGEYAVTKSYYHQHVSQPAEHVFTDVECNSGTQASGHEPKYQGSVVHFEDSGFMPALHPVEK